MEPRDQIMINPLKRRFDEMDPDPVLEIDRMDVDQDKSCFKPRQYQVKIFEIAMKKNTIAVLETGSGKTLIAVMLIKAAAESLKLSGEKKLIVFLAPTVLLVQQQCKDIKAQTKLRVEDYYGAKGLDDWTLDMWEEDIKKYDVFVMTPQILLDALRKAFVSYESICLLVIDECHRATGNHAYTKIMEEFHHRSTKKVKIFGMTASPVIRKGVSSARDCEQQLSELELLLDSQICTIENMNEVEEFIPFAKSSCKFYDPAASLNLQLKENLESSWSKFNAAFVELQNSQPVKYQDIAEKSEALRKKLSNDHAKILCCLEDLGLICAYEAVKVCIEKSRNIGEECDSYKSSSLQYKQFLEEASTIMKKSLPMDIEKLLDDEFDYEEAVRMGYISGKLHVLLEIFNSFGNSEQVLCLIFVDRIITAKVIERIAKKIKHLSHFSISYLTGGNASVDGLARNAQKETLQSFRSGEVNLLFTTDVIEEGIHVPDCSTVIRFDLPKTVRSYIQSRGRARQSNSQFVMMVERGNKKQRDQMFDIIRSEHAMASTAKNRDSVTSVTKPRAIKVAETYCVAVTGASVSLDSSVSLINTYCGKLPRDNYFTPKPDFQYLLVGDSYQCKLTLPPNAAFQTITGPASTKCQLSKQLVCLDACKKLHELGALDDHLLPLSEKASVSDPTGNSKGSALGPGTTKRKELHGTTSIRALSGNWAKKPETTLLHAYEIHFSCSIVDELYSSFVLLLETKLDDDVGNVEFELYLISKFVKASVSYCGQMSLDAEQVAKAKGFHELFFNALFGKVFVKLSGKRQLLFQTEESLWDESNMYLLLPLNTSQKPKGDESWEINWREVESCVSVVNFLKKNAWLTAEESKKARESLFDNRTVSDDFENTNVVHLANKSVRRTELNDMVVMAVHTGRIYHGVDAIEKSSSESPFHENADGTPAPYSSFFDYFKKKYGITLLLPKQPLLLLKQSHNPHNLLVDFKKEGPKCPEGDNIESIEWTQNHVHMPPELLICMDVRRDLLRAFYLLPSLMHRMESLMLASQLREQISSHSGDSHISSKLILEALTSLRCNESFSMERLELLGDSVMKYAVSCHLFLHYPNKHEGQLSSLRSKAVCNFTLHKVGTDRKLQGYIRDSPFDPRRWTAPGQRSIRACPCDHGVETLEVPLDDKYVTENIKVVGICCDRGHRWMGSKTISDCVEGLIGAYYVGGGLIGALRLMKWLGMDAELEPSLVEQAIQTASLHCYVPKAKDIEILESKIGYTFTVKGLLLEAITHATEQDRNVDYCYQRLEYLGDAVLDILVTRHLYENHTETDPGELTDLRSASVNNENFAHAAIRRNLYPHIQHCSGLLKSQIQYFAQAVIDSCSAMESPPSKNCPKVLGDLVESIAGAVLIDSKLDLEEVWRIFEPILSPIVTPDKLELYPMRELTELCDSLGYFIKINCTTKGEMMVHVELKLQLKDALLVSEGQGQSRKTAKGQAAVKLLKQLEKRGISSSKKPRGEVENSSGTSPNAETTSCQISDSVTCKKKKITSSHSISTKSHPTNSGSASKAGDSEQTEIPVIAPIPLKRGGPRTSLFELCKKLQWPMPTFETSEEKSSKPIEFDEGTEKRIGFNSFESHISLTIPGFGVIELDGDKKADKKSSFDSAALLLLNELEHQGKVIISKP